MISRKGAKAQRRGNPVVHGFTLIEVVIAYSIAAVVLAVTASALIATLRSEATSHRQAQAVATLRTLQTQLWLGAATNSLATNLPPDWALANETVEQGEGTNRVVWTVWRVGPTAHAAFAAALAAAAP
jgi:prepilin-type N-terminal cleavage/methylation domain-containing protein